MLKTTIMFGLPMTFAIFKTQILRVEPRLANSGLSQHNKIFWIPVTAVLCKSYGYSCKSELQM